MAMTGYGNPRPIMREEPPRPPTTAPKPVSKTSTPTQSYGYGTDDYYRAYYENMRKQAEARAQAEMAAQQAAAQRAQAEFMRQQQIQMREQPQQQTGYGLPASDANAPVIRNTMPNMTQLAPPVIRDTMPEIQGREEQTAWQRYMNPEVRYNEEWLRNWLYGQKRDFSKDEMIYRFGKQLEAPWVEEEYGDIFSPRLQQSSYYGPSEWINPEVGPKEPRHVKNLPRTRKAIEGIMGVDYTYNPAIDPDSLEGEGNVGGGYGYTPYTPYSYGGYSYPRYDYKSPEPVKTWYENMLQWNI